MVNVGPDRGRAGVVANGQHHRHRVRGSSQAGVPRLHVERVSQGAGRLDQRLQAHTFDDPLEAERPVLVRREGVAPGSQANLAK
jgi:hypothetical protein